MHVGHARYVPFREVAVKRCVNILVIWVTLETSHLEMSLLNDDAPQNILDILVTLDTSHLEMSPLNDSAPINIPDILVTLDTSHFERSPLKPATLTNRLLRMSVTRDTSHSAIGPCAPLEQSPSAENPRHAVTAI